MAAEPVRPRRRRRWPLSPYFLLPVLVLVCGTGFYVLLALLRAKAQVLVDEQIEKIRERDEPVSLEDLAPAPVPDGENAAVLLAEAFTLLKEASTKENEGTIGWEGVLEGGTAADLQKLDNALTVYAEAMVKAREALERPRCRFDVDYTRGLALEFELDHPRAIWCLAWLFVAEAAVRADHGRGDEAVASTLHALRLGEVCRQEPLGNSQLMRLSCLRRGFAALERVVSLSPPSDASVRRALGQLAESRPETATTLLLIGQRAIAIHAFDRMISREMSVEGLERSDPAEAEGTKLPFWTMHVWLADEAFCLDIMTRAVDASRLVPPGSLRAINSLETERARKIGADEHILSTLIMPAFRPVHVRTLQTLAHRDAAVIGLSCELYRSRHGRYPDKLDELSPEFLDKLPPDPFTGKPFVYKLRDDGKGFVVYSVGQNLTDDGGVSDHSAGKDDIAWEGGQQPKP